MYCCTTILLLHYPDQLERHCMMIPNSYVVILSHCVSLALPLPSLSPYLSPYLSPPSHPTSRPTSRPSSLSLSPSLSAYLSPSLSPASGLLSHLPLPFLPGQGSSSMGGRAVQGWQDDPVGGRAPQGWQGDPVGGRVAQWVAG